MVRWDLARGALSVLGSLKAARIRLAAFRVACASAEVRIWGFTAHFMRKSMAAEQLLLSEAISSCALWRKMQARRPCPEVSASASYKTPLVSRVARSGREATPGTLPLAAFV